LLEAVSDDQLQKLFADLDRRGIALALEFPPLVSENCGFVEGFGDAGAALRLATRIQQNGGLLRYIAMDEPLYYAGIYAGPNACRWTSQKIAANAVVQIAQIKKIFPGVETGDIEPFPTQDELDIAGWKERFAAWFDAWRQAAGTPLAFFHSDVARSPAWRHSIDVLRRYAAQRAIPFGIIYNGVGNETTDADWINNAEQRFVDYETHGGAP